MATTKSARGEGNATAVPGLSEQENAELDSRGWVKSGEFIVWRLPNGTVRREKLAQVYYLHTTHGMFRVSKLNGEVVEV